MWGEEERKRTVLASSRKRADILCSLKWKSIVLVFNKFVCVMFFCVESQDLWSKLIIVFLVKTTLFFFVMKKKIIFEIPVRRKMLNVFQATNILIMEP